MKVVLSDLRSDEAQGVTDRGLHVHVLVGQFAGLGVGQVQQGVDRLPVGAVGLQDPGQYPAQVLGRGLRVGQGDVDHRLRGGQGSAQLVGGVGREPAVDGEGPLQGGQHVVEGVRQVVDLVARAGQVQPLTEVARGGALGRRIHRGQRLQHPPCQNPADGPGEHHEQRQRADGRAHDAAEQIEQVRVHLGGLADLRDWHGGGLPDRVADLDAQRDVARVEVDQGDEDHAGGRHHPGVGQGQTCPDTQVPGATHVLRAVRPDAVGLTGAVGPAVGAGPRRVVGPGPRSPLPAHALNL